jgi:predicted Zn-dependent protease
LKSVVAGLMAGQALEETAWGNCGPVRERTRAALARDRELETLGSGAGALAMCGDAAQAQALVEETAKRFPTDTISNAVGIPLVQATIEWKRNQPAKAIELLKRAAPYERAYTSVPYLRGQAYLEAKSGREAAAEFRKILDHRGAAWPVLYSLAHVGLARAAALAGDSAGSRKAYQDFFALWKDADPGVPILEEARREYAKLAPAP